MITNFIKMLGNTIVLHNFTNFSLKTYNCELSFIKVTLLNIFCILISIFMEIFHDNFEILAYGLFILILFVLYHNIFNCSKKYSILNAIVIYTILSLSKIVSFLVTNIIDSTFKEQIHSQTSLIYSIIFFIVDILAVNLTINILKNFKQLKNTIDKLNIKELALLILLTFSILIPNLLKFNSTDADYSLSLLSINTIQLINFIFLTFLYFKYNHRYIISQSELNNEKIYNQTLVEVVEELKVLKHDYNNILQSINGFIVTKQYSMLDEHIKKLSSETSKISNIEAINPEILNQPAIYGIVGSKYFVANKKNINFKLNVLTNINEICFDFTELSRVLGILLDNAIEASEKSDIPSISVTFSYNKAKQADIIEIKNSIKKGVKIDINNIFNKGVSSKKVKSGIGLWEVRKIISTKNNSQIYADVKDNLFSQTIIIEKI